jgi:hypothetical protein
VATTLDIYFCFTFYVAAPLGEIPHEITAPPPDQRNWYRAHAFVLVAVWSAVLLCCPQLYALLPPFSPAYFHLFHLCCMPDFACFSFDVVLLLVQPEHLLAQLLFDTPGPGRLSPPPRDLCICMNLIFVVSSLLDVNSPGHGYVA